MKYRLARPLLFVLVTAYLANCGISANKPFALELRSEQDSVPAGSEIKVEITLRNTSNRMIRTSFGLPEFDYSVRVHDALGRIPAETALARNAKERSYFSNDQSFTLQPGESLPAATLLLTKLYDLSSPGRYTVQVSRAVPKELGGGTVESNLLTIAVVQPPDRPVAH